MKQKIITPISFTFFSALLFVMYMSSACTKHEKNLSYVNSVDLDSDSVQAEDTDTIDSDTYNTGGQDKDRRFKLLRYNWKTQIVNTDYTPTVVDFMNIIKNHYDIPINKSENDYDREEIKDVERGYCSLGQRFEENHISCMLWNRDNGHKLIPFLYGSIHGDGAWCFYDYDPNTKQLALDSVITDQFKDVNLTLYNTLGFSCRGEDFEDYNIYIWNGKDFSRYGSEDEYISKSWKPQEVKAVSKVGKPSVLDFMNTFTDYLGYRWEKDELYKLDTRNGYCSVLSSDNVIECVIWNRNNKHVLICISLIPYYNDACCCGPIDFQLFFYDYNPNTKILSAETGLTKKFKPFVESTGSCYDFGSVIPKQGKDIKIDQTTFKWNGYDFDFPN